MKHCFLTKAILHLPEGETLDVVVKSLDIQKVSGSVTAKDQIKV